MERRGPAKGRTPTRRTSPRGSRNALLLALLAVVLLAGFWSGFPGITGSEAVPGSGGATPRTTPAVSGAQFPTPIRHVIVVMLENENQATVLKQGPFEKHLAQTYSSASNYYAICHPSAPNYLAITSGKTWQCGSDAYHVYSTTNLATLVDAAGLKWRAYDESMPKPCDKSNAGLYAVRHTPFMFYSDVVGNTTFCRAHIVNSKYFNESAANGTLPNLSFYTPNLLDDGHNTNVPFADAWLKGWLSPLLNDSIFSKSVFLITYDESGNSNAGYNGTAGGKVYFTAVSPDVKTDFTYTSNASHYNLLTTIEWLLGLGHTGQNDSWSLWPPMQSMFKSSKAVAPTHTGSTLSASVPTSRTRATGSLGGGSSTAPSAAGTIVLGPAGRTCAGNAPARGSSVLRRP